LCPRDLTHLRKRDFILQKGRLKLWYVERHQKPLTSWDTLDIPEAITTAITVKGMPSMAPPDIQRKIGRISIQHPSHSSENTT